MVEFKHLQEALAQYAEAIVDRYKQNLEDSDRRATGNLITSINSKVSVNGNEYEVLLQLEDYWKYIENGTKPHFPPVSKILDWVKIKPILPTPMKNGKLPTEEQLAWMIAKKIDRVGTEGKPDLEEALEEVDYNAIIEEALDADIMESLDEIFMLIG